MVPEGWKVCRLDDIADYRRGSFPQPYGLDKWFDDKGHPFVQVYDVDKNLKLKQFTKAKISDLAAEQSVFAPKGTILVTLQGSIGRVAITQYSAYVDRTLLVIRGLKLPGDNLYLATALQELFAKEKEKAPGGTIKTITKAVLSNFRIFWPPIDEQKKIAQILFTWDQAITATERLLENSQQRKKGLMQQLLTGKKRLPGFEGEWEEVPLSELADYVKGYTYKSNEYSEIPTSTGFLTLKSLLRGGGYSKGGLKYLTTEIEDKFLVKEGDIVFAVTDITRGAEIVGAPLLVPNLRLPQVAISMDMVKLLVKPGVAPKFLYFALKRSTARNFMRSRASGSTVLHLDVKGSKKLRLPIPRDANEQEAISDVMTIADQEIEAIAQRLILLKEEKKALMQQLLTGKRRGKVDTEAA